MFSDELLNYDWEATSTAIMAKTAADVERALNARHPSVDDFMALISPAAAPYLEQMAAPPLHPGKVRQDNIDVHPHVHHQFMHKLMRLLRLQPPQRIRSRSSHP